jgi:hypothetical protein
MATAAVPQLFQGVDKSSFGYKLLAKTGWKEGEGLVGVQYVSWIAHAPQQVAQPTNSAPSLPCRAPSARESPST